MCSSDLPGHPVHLEHDVDDAAGGCRQTGRRSAVEIEREIFFVAKKIKEYRFRRCADGSPYAAPPVACDMLVDIRLNRLALFDTLGKLGDLYLSSELLLPKIALQKVDSVEAVRDVSHRVRFA